MKPLLKMLDSHLNNSFTVLNFCDQNFYPYFHFHQEFEITLIQEGKGTRIVSNSMEPFGPGDLVMYGPNLSHVYRNDENHFEGETKQVSKSIVIHFKKNFLGDQFWNTPELASVNQQLQSAKHGIKFMGESRNLLEGKILEFSENAKGIQGIINLLDILKTIAESKEYRLLSSYPLLQHDIDTHNSERLKNVYQYVMERYNSGPTLEEVAKIACMSPSAFCRYFKNQTGKTYVQFLNEVKIGNASKMLITKRSSIKRICFESGFNNINHFNNLFKRIIGLTPADYQKSIYKCSV